MSTTLWEAAGTYPAVCRALQFVASTGTTLPPELVGRAGELAQAMRHAHVVTCSREQVEALPRLPEDDLVPYAKHLRPPFPITYLSLGGVTIGDIVLDGALLFDGDLVDGMLAPNDGAWTTCPIPRVTLVGEELRCPTLDRFRVDASTGNSRDAVELGPPREPELDDRRRLGIIEEVERVIAVLLLLDNTVGVELREQDRREVSRQVLRQAERKGARIAWTVAVSVPKRSRPANGKPVSKANYSHRFERAANFACVTKGPHVADPAKLSSWCPRHGTKACRREFRPATIVGPAHLPLVPKVRQIREAA